MNFRDESGLNPGINEIAPVVPGSRGGFGLAQWTGPRRRELEAYAQARGVPVDDINMQLDFLVSELQGPESGAASRIMATQDAGQAAAAIVEHFLRPADQHRESRIANYTSGAGYSGGGGSAPQGGGMSGGGMNPQIIAQLAELASNPYLPEGQRMIAQQLIATQLQGMDPMRQLEMQRAQMEIEAMRNPQPDMTSDMQEYQFALGQGFNGTFLDFQTAQAQAGRAETNITTNVGGDKFDEQFASQDATALAEVGSAGMAAQRNISRIDQLESLLTESPSGFAANLALKAGEYGINTEGLDTLQAAQAVTRFDASSRPP
jgi:hypothetical protein